MTRLIVFDSRVLCAAMISVLSFACLSGQATGSDPPTQPTGKPQPRITPSRTRTKAVSPLDDDGYVDYVAALNEVYSRHVTPENNAGLLLVRASRIEGLGPAERKRFFELLHCEPLPEEGVFLTDLEEYVQKRFGRPPTQRELEDRARAINRPWSAREFPLVAQWVEFNERPLQLVVEATRRSKCYFPFVLPKGACVFDMPLPALQASRTAARILVARALRRLNDGQIEQAENDLLASHRLGRLIGTTPFCIGALVGMAIDAYAWSGDVALMQSDRLKADRALAYQRELRQLAPPPRLDETLESEQWSYLQALGVLARPKALNGERSAIFKEMPAFVSETTLLDWNEVLDAGNAQFDRVAAILRETSVPRQQAAWERFHREFSALHEQVQTHAFNQLPLKDQLSRKAVSREFGKIMITSFFPAVRALSEAEHRMRARAALAQVGLALAAYRADRGRYPDALNELSPLYISQVPGDPFIEQPLHYERRRDGFSLYSVGPNGKENRGAAEPDLVIKVIR
jgi:hypothetical protein